MSLVTPDFGLLFWMILIFGLVFFLLAKFGFPVISSMVAKRSEHIEESLQKARQAQESLENIVQESQKIIDEARKQQGRMLEEAAATRDKIIAEAKQRAHQESEKIVAHAKIQIEAERQTALRGLCNQISLIAVEIAEKIIKKELNDSSEQMKFIDRLVDEYINSDMKS